MNMQMYKKARQRYMQWHSAHGLSMPRNPTIEHIVPRKMLLKLDKPKFAELESNMHNFMLLPSRLNSQRGHLPYTDAVKEGVWLTDETGELCVGEDEASCCCKSTDAFLPSLRMKGRISRAVGYMMLKDPQGYAPLLHASVLNFATLLKWHLACPVSSTERILNTEIAKHQGEPNLLIDEPDRILDLLRPILEPGFIDAFLRRARTSWPPPS
jgi:endonuclease I